MLKQIMFILHGQYKLYVAEDADASLNVAHPRRAGGRCFPCRARGRGVKTPLPL